MYFFSLQIIHLNLGDVFITTAPPNSVTFHVNDASVKVSSGWTAYITIFWYKFRTYMLLLLFALAAHRE